MDCKKPVILKTGLTVPCGKCLACRIQKRREWTLRCLHELISSNHEAMFVTLTYSDDHLPEHQSLCKEHLRNFFKRLRKTLAKNQIKIRYFACGEYGDQTQRPHYHAIIFGLPFNNTSKKYIMQSWPYCDWNISHIRNGSFGVAEQDSIRYVCQYIDKKFTGVLAKQEYEYKKREPVFKWSSQGIGRDWIDQNYKQIKENLSITLNGVNHSIPRYYIQRIDLDISSIQNKLEIDQDKRFKKITGFKKVKSGDRGHYEGYSHKISKYESDRRKSRAQNEKNLTSKLNLKRKKL